jgi:hypothetical protein
MIQHPHRLNECFADTVKVFVGQGTIVNRLFLVLQVKNHTGGNIYPPFFFLNFLKPLEGRGSL